MTTHQGRHGARPGVSDTQKAGIAVYAQSGGVTAVINATAYGVLETVRRHPDRIGGLYAGRNGILGLLREEMLDLSDAPEDELAALLHTPGGAFGSCRYKLADPEQDAREYERLLQVFSAHGVRYFFYNGGGDSQDTVLKVARLAAQRGLELSCIGIPKTVDNDLPVTDNCPGFGSVAKYVAVSVREAGLDVASMAETSTKVFILEVMGRHSGWIAAAAGLAADRPGDPPHLILFPEVPFDSPRFLEAVRNTVEHAGYCVVVVSEGVRDTKGRFLAEGGSQDAFGHAQLGGAAPVLAQLVKEKLGYKLHWAVADYLQRSARHLASQVDVEQARALGQAAVKLALAGHNGVLPIILRRSDEPYRWEIGSASLEEVANRERKLPATYLREDGFGISAAGRRYLAPLIRGEAYPPYDEKGLPRYARLTLPRVKKRLPQPFVKP